MGQVEELETRIAAAFQRISDGVEALIAARSPEGDGGGQDLAEALAAEQDRSAQLAERLRSLGEERAQAEAALRAEVDRLNRALDAQGLDVQRLTSTVAQLREDLRRLSEGVEQGVADPAMINRAMLAELEALRSTRAAEANEMSEILSSLAMVLDAEEARPHA